MSIEINNQTSEVIVKAPLDGKVLENVERQLFVAALTATGGEVCKAAALLGCSPRTIYYRLDRWGMQAQDFRASGAQNECA